MQILVLGGGIFIGRHFVETALNRGHQVAVFSRFKSRSDFPSCVEKLKGDRYSDLSCLKNRTWDVIIDTSGYLPSAVSNSAEILKGQAQQYVYISSVSAYKDLDKSTIDETSLLVEIDDESLHKAESIDKNDSPTAMSFGESYGGLKSKCEDIVRNIFYNQSLIVRAGLVVGPYDYTNRFIYWPQRFQEGGECIIPSNSISPICFIDARDITEWVITMVEKRQSGTFNTTGMRHGLSFDELLNSCRDIFASNLELIEINSDFIEENGIRLWEELPLLLPTPAQGFARIDDKKAVEHGLTYRPLKTTIHDTLHWSNSLTPVYKIKVGMDNSRERELVNKWKNLNKQDTHRKRK